MCYAYGDTYSNGIYSGEVMMRRICIRYKDISSKGLGETVSTFSEFYVDWASLSITAT